MEFVLAQRDQVQVEELLELITGADPSWLFQPGVDYQPL
jgi:hypothetical protein